MHLQAQQRLQEEGCVVDIKHQKYETISWFVIGVVYDLNTLCDEDGPRPDYMIL